MSAMPNTTLQTVLDYATDARRLLLDRIAPYRYSDDALVDGLNIAMLEASRIRQDLFVYTGDGQPPTFTTPIDTTPVVIDPPFRLAFLYGMTAHILLRDEEDIQDARANTFNSVFHDLLIGVRPSAIQGGTPNGQSPNNRPGGR